MRPLFFILFFISVSAAAQRDTIIAGRRCHLIADSDTGTSWIQMTIHTKKFGDQFRGAYFEFYKSGRIKVQGFYKLGKRSDKWIGYYEDGNKSFEGYFSKGYKSDLWMEYFPGGHLSWKGNFFKNMRSGFWRYYYENGKLRSMTRYEIHTRVESVPAPPRSKGASIRVNKKIFYTITPCDSLVEYYQDGTLKIRFSYGHHGGLNGKVQYFYSNGAKNREGMYVDGKAAGVWKYFCTDGKEYKNVTYGSDGNAETSQLDNSEAKDCVYVEIQPEMKWQPEEI
jgi:antitoxin component YwqK of YwqJK toxin-antitoxin module